MNKITVILLVALCAIAGSMLIIRCIPADEPFLRAVAATFMVCCFNIAGNLKTYWFMLIHRRVR